MSNQYRNGQREYPCNFQAICIPKIRLYSLIHTTTRIIKFSLKIRFQVIQNRLHGLSYDDLYNLVQGEWDQFLSGIMRISSKCNFCIIFMENGAKPCWERHSTTEDYQLKDCIQNEDLSTLAHFPRLEF